MKDMMISGVMNPCQAMGKASNSHPLSDDVYYRCTFVVLSKAWKSVLINPLIRKELEQGGNALVPKLQNPFPLHHF